MRGSLMGGALVVSTMAYGLVHGLQQSDEAIARVRGTLELSIRVAALLITAICVADAGATASLLSCTTLALIWALGMMWNSTRQAAIACRHRYRRRRRRLDGGSGSSSPAEGAAEPGTDSDDEPPSPDGAGAGAGTSRPRFNRDFVCANYDSAQSAVEDFHARGAELAATEVAKLMASEEFRERFHADRLHPSRQTGLAEVCAIL